MYSRTNLLLIEDDKSDIISITNLLETNGYKVTAALTGNEGLSLAASLCPDVILLNLGLPDMDGYKVLQQLRSWSNIPIIILSTRCEEAEKVMALDSGADDYVTKPFGTEELLARIRTALRRQRPRIPDRIYKARELEINFDKRLVRLAGKEIHMTQIEYQLLTLLAEHSGKIVNYNDIMNTIWGPYISAICGKRLRKTLQSRNTYTQRSASATACWKTKTPTLFRESASFKGVLRS